MPINNTPWDYKWEMYSSLLKMPPNVHSPVAVTTISFASNNLLKVWSHPHRKKLLSFTCCKQLKCVRMCASCLPFKNPHGWMPDARGVTNKVYSQFARQTGTLVHVWLHVYVIVVTKCLCTRQSAPCRSNMRARSWEANKPEWRVTHYSEKKWSNGRGWCSSSDSTWLWVQTWGLQQSRAAGAQVECGCVPFRARTLTKSEILHSAVWGTCVSSTLSQHLYI